VAELSKFAHSHDLGEYVAVWHSLRMKPVFLTKEAFNNLQCGLYSSEIEKELTSKKILLSYPGEDTDVINRVRQKVPPPGVGLGYFLLSERCNLACEYCFMGSNTHKQGAALHKDMTREVADKAISFFIRQLISSGIDFSKNKPQIIFFGGEPLIAFDTLDYVVKRINELKGECSVLANIEMSIITNGTLLTKERIQRLNDLGVAVSISIDGPSETANKMRVDATGKGAFDRIIDVLDLCKKMQVKVGLSVTLTEDTIRDLPGMLKLVKDYEIKGFGYNIPMCNESFQVSDDFYAEASRFIIESFKALRTMGVYEDRIMRKLITFSSSQIYFSDCGATGGGQVVFTPDGRVGLCHGLLEDKEHFVTTVDDGTFIASEHPLWREWASLSPINQDECIDCEALGICGGGCPVNARFLNPGKKGLQTIDGRTCIHSKSTLRFLIEDLYNIARERQ